jgi:eukaryotic-like serine/threonine-protein kinase
MHKRLVTRLLIVLTVIVTSTGARTRAVRRVGPPPAPSAFHYRGGAARTGVYDTAGVPVLHGRKWLTTTVSNSFSAPVYANGVLYVLDGSGHVVALDALTGRSKWTSSRIGSILSSPTVTEDAVYVGVETNGTVALSIADGSQIAKFATDSEAFASPVVEGTTLYQATEGGSLYAFDLKTRAQRWRFTGSGPMHGHPAVANGVTYAGGFTELLAVDAAGQLKWRIPAAPNTQWFANPAVSGGVVYDNDGDTMYAIDAETGSILWSSRLSAGTFFTAPVVWNGLVIAGGTDKHVTAFNAASGTVAWQISVGDTVEVIGTNDGVIYGGLFTATQNANPNAAQTFYAIDARNGQVLWTFDVIGQTQAGTAVGDGKVFVHTQARNVYALE